MKRIILIIILSQLFCTSMWFAGNAILPELIRTHGFGADFLGDMTSAVQLGFIIGTFVIAWFALSDRHSPSRVFFVCSIVGALCNLGTSLNSNNPYVFICARFLTGFFLAGIYPVGMKIAADYFQKGLGVSLGFLLGALVLGTALPHLLKTLLISINWKNVIYVTSTLSLIGGSVLFLLVPDGPYRKASQHFRLSGFLEGFKIKEVRNAAFAYFGHMWELYTFWAFIPVMLTAWNLNHAAELNVPLLSFFIIASGSLSCIVSGFLSRSLGPKRVARLALIISCCCCFCAGFFLESQSPALMLAFLFVWGLAVIADSPMFSTLIGQHAPPEIRGSTLTLVNCIGFSITIISIQFFNILVYNFSTPTVYALLGVGPAIGIWVLFRS